ncbi:MAG: ribosome biogenesis GTPase YqeH [Bacillota bacterium]|nr:ribosome biogenesis GTPase YqeH [Bacillota bacterium]
MKQGKRICPGCGAVLQSEDETRPGYVPAQVLAEREEVTCQRCFRITHYNEVMTVRLEAEEFARILERIGQTDALVVKLVDLFDVNGTWIPDVARYTGDNPILLVGNKVDLLPRQTNWQKVRLWLEGMTRELGLIPTRIELCSGKKGLRLEAVAEAIEELRAGRDVYVIGVTNVGKSTFLNRLLSLYGVGTRRPITTSRFPGTTLDVIEIPLGDGRRLYDTPGIVNEQQISNMVSPQDLKILIPEETLRPRVYQLNDQQTLFFGGLARLDFVRGERQSFVCYVSNRLRIHRTKLANADALYERHRGGLLSPPRGSDWQRLPPWVRHTFEVPPDPVDIVISGLGWVSVRGTGALVDVYAPRGVGVGLRRALI